MSHDPLFVTDQPRSHLSLHPMPLPETTKDILAGTYGLLMCKVRLVVLRRSLLASTYGLAATDSRPFDIVKVRVQTAPPGYFKGACVF